MRLAPLVGLVLAVLLAGFTGWQRSALRSDDWARTDFALLDSWTRLSAQLEASGLAPRRPPPSDLVVVAIDDATVEAHPTLLERRAEMAALIERVGSAGPRVIAIDLFFSDPELLLPAPIKADLDAWIAEPTPDTPSEAAELLTRIHDETLGDDALEAALDAHPTLLAAHFGRNGELASDDRSLTKATYAQVVPGEQLPASAPRVLASLPRFNRAASRLGIITVYEDPGGVRRIPLAGRSGPRHFVPFALQAVAAFDGTSRGMLAFLGTDSTAMLGERRVAGPDNALWLDWRHPSAYPTVSAAALLREGGPDAATREALADRLVFVGFDHFVHDRVPTPFGSMPGVFTHAAAADAVLSDSALVRAPAWVDALLTGALGGVVALVFAIPGFRTSRRLATVLVVGAVAAAVPAAARVFGAVWIGGLGPLVAVGLVGAASASIAWLREGAQARELRRMFAHYVSDDLIAAMVADPTMVQVRGERRELTVLFSDIRDFTSFSEQLPPLELVAFLNAYLTPMTRAVLDHRGFVDKFIGDAVMALFGAPVPDGSHADSAVQAALAMHRALEDVRPVAAQYGISLDIGVGVNTGEVAVGNMGSEERFEYTVLGDAVNLASRLEGLTKQYGVFCLVGPGTARALSGSVRLRRLDLVRVKGKAEPVEVFELLGDADTTVASYLQPETWDAAVRAFREGDLERARQLFQAFRDANPEDPVSRVYAERLAALGDRVPTGWDGVFTHTHK